MVYVNTRKGLATQLPIVKFFPAHVCTMHLLLVYVWYVCICLVERIVLLIVHLMQFVWCVSDCASLFTILYMRIPFRVCFISKLNFKWIVSVVITNPVWEDSLLSLFLLFCSSAFSILIYSWHLAGFCFSSFSISVILAESD